MISAIAWVPKGASMSQPVVTYLPSKEEIEEFISGEDEENEDMEVGANDPDDEVAQVLSVADVFGKPLVEKCDDITLGLKELDMDNYDEEDEGVELFSSGIGDLYYPSNDQDPYLNHENDDDSEEAEDMTIYPTDSVVVCALLKKHDCCLEHVHSAQLGQIPHLKEEKEGTSSLLVLRMNLLLRFGTIVDEVKPCMVLGGFAKKKKKGKKSNEFKDGSHTDSVLFLDWNKNILASGSADKQVKIRDVASGKCDITMEHHSDKVQAVAWNHYAPQILLSGSFDRTVVMKDVRMPSHSGFKWSVPADVESLAWDPHAEHSFVVSLENGMVKGIDVRAIQSDSTSQSTVFTLHAHDEAFTSVSYNLSAANLLATVSMDKME
ncbi:hypothetical protein K1719_030704 [Acacia pycnantha]|nr:hypothetical protein K1719_030704 [Acacia pycnantha]